MSNPTKSEDSEAGEVPLGGSSSDSRLCGNNECRGDAKTLRLLPARDMLPYQGKRFPESGRQKPRDQLWHRIEAGIIQRDPDRL